MIVLLHAAQSYAKSASLVFLYVSHDTCLAALPNMSYVPV